VSDFIRLDNFVKLERHDPLSLFREKFWGTSWASEEESWRTENAQMLATHLADAGESEGEELVDYTNGCCIMQFGDELRPRTTRRTTDAFSLLKTMSIECQLTSEARPSISSSQPWSIQTTPTPSLRVWSAMTPATLLYSPPLPRRKDGLALVKLSCPSFST
jgi:hypothetical protein